MPSSKDKIMIRIAQVLGALPTFFFAGMFLIVGIGSLFPDESDPTDPMTFYIELLPVLILIICAIGAYIYAFRHPTTPKSGILLISIGVAIFLDILLTKLIRYSASLETLQAGLMGGAIYGIPLTLEGILFLLAAHFSSESIKGAKNEADNSQSDQ